MKRFVQSGILAVFSVMLINGFVNQTSNEAAAATQQTGNSRIDRLTAWIEALRDLCSEGCGDTDDVHGGDGGADSGGSADGGFDGGFDSGFDGGFDGGGFDSGGDGGGGADCCECTGVLAFLIDVLTAWANFLRWLFGYPPLA